VTPTRLQVDTPLLYLHSGWLMVQASARTRETVCSLVGGLVLGPRNNARLQTMIYAYILNSS
jgi:hypothetical protein